jgi:signal peptidase I
MSKSSNKKPYSLGKSKHILLTSCSWYRKYKARLPESDQSELSTCLKALDLAVEENDKEKSTQLAKSADETISKHHFHGAWQYLEVLTACVIAIILAFIIIRPMWFELYEIPTGSMRPTFKEKDRLIVTKTSFGLNIPLKPAHLTFNPNDISRGGIVIWSGDNIDMPETETLFMGLIPHTKRYIKRLIGKPGDVLYFYGGQIYGIDKDGKAIDDLRNKEWMSKLEHIPFMFMEGRVNQMDRAGTEFLFKQMNQPFARVNFRGDASTIAEIYDGDMWVSEMPANPPSKKRDNFGAYLGSENFATARLLTEEQIPQIQRSDFLNKEKAPLYLQLAHNPKLTYPKPKRFQTQSGYHVALTPLETVIPLQEEHIQAIRDHLYTARFIVKNGKAYRYGSTDYQHPSVLITLDKVPDGTYEFYHGVPSEIGFGGWSKPLAKDHPLSQLATDDIQTFYNLGMEFRKTLMPYAGYGDRYPSRYAYFRDGDLYLQGQPVLKKEDPILIAYQEQEIAHAAKQRSYTPFLDYGPPLLEDGSLDMERVKALGLHIPEKNYLVMGDNHANSMDSRYFGFLPEDNLEGSPVGIFWPPQERLGAPPQAPYPWITTPRLIVWTILLISGLLYFLWNKKQNTYPRFRED